MIREKGYPLIDADILARQALDDPEVFDRVIVEFDCMEDGKIDRKKLGRIIFSDPQAKAALEALIHPFVIAKIEEFIQGRQDEKLVFLDIPLLFEVHLEYLCDKVVVVDVSLKNQIDRLKERDGIDEEYAKKIIKSQMPLEQKVKKADYVIDNNGSIEELKDQVEKVIEQLWTC